MRFTLRESVLSTRRSFLAGSAAIAAASHPLARLAAQTRTDAAVTISIDSSMHLATVPEDFTGLSYESAQLGHPEFFSAENKALIGLFRALGKQGVLRIGGNTGEYTTWSSNDADVEKNHTPLAMGPDAGTAAKTASIITPVAIRNLREFIDAVGLAHYLWAEPVAWNSRECGRGGEVCRKHAWRAPDYVSDRQ